MLLVQVNQMFITLVSLCLCFLLSKEINNVFNIKEVSEILVYYVLFIALYYFGIINFQIIGTFFIFLSCLSLLFYKKYPHLYTPLSKFLALMGCFIFVLSIDGVLLMASHNIFNNYLTKIILCCVSFDTFGYIFGKYFKGKKILPLVSPGKTYSGLIGSYLAVLAICYLFITENYILYSIAITFGCLVGDLIYSLFKRMNNKKDYGDILEGHGGILDRVDSFIGAVCIVNALSFF
jgi:phosphatidate cytidylyltransferase